MTRQHAALASVSLGLLVLLASFLAPRLIDGRSAWSDEQAERYSELSLRMHALAFSPPSEKTTAELGAMRAEFEDLGGRLEAARGRGTLWARGLRVGAVALITGGLLLQKRGS